MADAATVSGGRFWGGSVYEPLYRGRVEPVSVHRSLGVADPVRRLPRLKEDEVYRFDVEKARRVEKFVENLVIWEGEWAGRKMHLLPWQRRILWDLFGWVRRDNGLRRFRWAYIEVPRKNGKSTFSAPIAAYLLMADGESGAQVYSAAGDRSQASIVFKSTLNMLMAQPTLRQRIRPIDSDRTIIYPKTNSVYMALSRIAENKHGTNPSGVIYDELHVVKDRSLFQALVSGMGARRQPLFLMLTTAGHDRTSICWEQHEYSRMVLTGEIDDPTWYPVIYGADANGDWTSEKQWAKANPSYGVIVKRDHLAGQVQKAVDVPSEQNEVKRLHLNIWTQSAVKWLDLGRWDQCLEVPTDPEAWPPEGSVCWAGLDLSSTIDLTSMCVCWRDDEQRIYRLRWKHWVPSEGIAERSRRDVAPYEAWARDGWIVQTPGARVDYQFVRAEINWLANRYDLQEVAYDPYNAATLAQELDEQDGITMVQIRQGYKSLNEPSKELEALVLTNKLRHNGDPVARWAAGNVAVTRDPTGSIKPSKAPGDSTGRIDPIAAAVMAIGRAMLHKAPEASIYETQDLIVM